MDKRIAKLLLFGIEFIRKEKLFHYLSELENNQFLDPEQINEIQKIKLQNLISSVIKNNKYYREKYRECDALNGFQYLPILTKEELRDNFKEIISSNSSKPLDLVETSGSTGIPLQFFRDRIIFGYNLASLYRARKWWNIDIGDKEAMLWGVPIAFKARMKAKMRDILLNRFREREYNINPDTLRHFYRLILKNNPKYIFGYTSMIYEFALFINESKLDGACLKLSGIICSAEKLFDYQREVMTDTFACPVISEYGATETGIISHECPKGSHHINDDCLYVEIVDKKNHPLPDGETGRVLVTVLHSQSVPIIRYELGDTASIAANRCNCGVNLSVLKKIEGRTSDIVVTPDGKIFHSIIFYYIFKNFTEKHGGIKQYKIFQRSIDHLELMIVKSSEYTENKETALRQNIVEKLGKKINLTINYCDNIEREKSGKLRDFKTNLNTIQYLRSSYKPELQSKVRPS